jgi:hypothetical protein
VGREAWQAHWASDPTFLAVYDGGVICCAGGLVPDTRPKAGASAERACSGALGDRGRQAVALTAGR